MPTLINRLSETKYLRSILLILNALAAESTCVSALAAVPNSLTAIHVSSSQSLIFIKRSLKLKDFF